MIRYTAGMNESAKSKISGGQPARSRDSRISLEALARAINIVRTRSASQKEGLLDESFRAQPTLLGTVLALPRMGVPMERVEFALELLLVCFQAMKESGLHWPQISEDELNRQAARYGAIVQSSMGMHPSRVHQAQEQYAASHSEPALLAYASTETTRWLASVAPLDSDKYVLLATMNIVNCIASVPLTQQAG